MFDIGEFVAENFRLFSGKHTINFPTAPGLYYIHGVNKNNKRMGPNGIGKSTLLDMIYWCAYGRTLRGAHGKRVITRGKTTCRVTGVFRVGKDTFEVSRSQNPNSLKLNGKDVKQEAVTKALRLTPESCTYSIIAPQFGDTFFDLKPEKKLTLFTQIMGLDHWLEKSATAADLSKELDEQKQKLIVKRDNYTNQVAQIDTDVTHLTQLAESFNEDKQTKLEQFIRKIEALMTEEPKARKQLETARASFKGANARLTKVTAQLDAAEKLLKAAIADKNKAEIAEATVATELDIAEDVLKRFNKIEGECPHCLQKVDNKHREKIRKFLKSAMTRIEESFHDGNAHKKSAEIMANTAESNVKKIKSELKVIEANQVDFAREITTLERVANQTVDELEALQQQAEQERIRPNPYKVLIKDKLLVRSDLNKKYSKVMAKIDTLMQDHAAVSFWVQGFKKLRLMLVEEVLAQLEIEINNNLTELGMTDWAITLDVEREKKTGGVTKGFTVLVYPPNDKEPMALEDWSGGELQRLRMAGDLGMANLIMERAGLKSAIEFYDEPSHHLSREGLFDLAEALAQRAEETNRRIFMVDHHVMEFGGFTGTLSVVRDKNGAHLEKH